MLLRPSAPGTFDPSEAVGRANAPALEASDREALSSSSLCPLARPSTSVLFSLGAQTWSSSLTPTPPLAPAHLFGGGLMDHLSTAEPTTCRMDVLRGRDGSDRPEALWDVSGGGVRPTRPI